MLDNNRRNSGTCHFSLRSLWPALLVVAVITFPTEAAAAKCTELDSGSERKIVLAALRAARAARADAETDFQAAYGRSEGIGTARSELRNATNELGTCIDNINERLRGKRTALDGTDDALTPCADAICSPGGRLEKVSTAAKTARNVAEFSEDYERALAAESAGEGDASGGGSAYYDARDLREAAERRTAELKTLAEVQLARYRILIASGADKGAFDPFEDAELTKLLGPKAGSFPTLSLGAQAHQKSIGGTVSAPVSELLSVATSVALKKAKRDGLALLQQKLRGLVCDLDDPGDKTKVFPETCQMLKSTSLEQIATDPRALQPSLTADLVTFASKKVQVRIFGSTTGDPRVELAGETLKLAMTLVGRVRSEQLPVPSAVDSRALVQALAKMRTMPGWGQNLAVPIGLEALGLYVTSGGKTDIRSIVDSLGTAVDQSTRTSAVEIGLLGIRALGLAREPDALTTHDAWRAAIELSFVVTEFALDETARAEHGQTLKLARKVALAVADGNTPEALTGAANLAITLLPPHTECSGEWVPEAKRKAGAAATCSFELDMERIAGILSGIASYSVTYVAAANADKSDGELRAAREKALEGVVDLVTQRAYRHGEWVVSLGIPVGFSAGGQYLLNRGGKSEGWQAMYPQLQVPLGIAVQRLPGAHYARGKGRCSACSPDDPNDFQYDGIHMMATLIDLGQYAAYEGDGTPSQLRWDSLFSPGLQVGWAFGTPANSFLVSAEGRYAPTLFSGTSSLAIEDGQLGGAVRMGLTLSYYVSLVDFN